MVTYTYCDNDGFTSSNDAAIIAHMAANPTHVTHMGFAGDSGVPAAYGGSSGLSVVTTDPGSPTTDQMWILKQGGAGMAMGVLGLTYTDFNYYLSIRGTISTYRVQLT